MAQTTTPTRATTNPAEQTSRMCRLQEDGGWKWFGLVPAVGAGATLLAFALAPAGAAAFFGGVPPLIVAMFMAHLAMIAAASAFGIWTMVQFALQEAKASSAEVVAAPHATEATPEVELGAPAQPMLSAETNTPAAAETVGSAVLQDDAEVIDPYEEPIPCVRLFWQRAAFREDGSILLTTYKTDPHDGSNEIIESSRTVLPNQLPKGTWVGTSDPSQKRGSAPS